MASTRLSQLPTRESQSDMAVGDDCLSWCEINGCCSYAGNGCGMCGDVEVGMVLYYGVPDQEMIGLK